MTVMVFGLRFNYDTRTRYAITFWLGHDEARRIFGGTWARNDLHPRTVRA